MTEGHVTDQGGVDKIRKYLRSQQYIKQPTSVCAEHHQDVQIADDGEKIIMKGCCRGNVLRLLDHISRSTDWLDFYNSLNSID